jgi:hypothetical protein
MGSIRHVVEALFDRPRMEVIKIKLLVLAFIASPFSTRIADKKHIKRFFSPRKYAFTWGNGNDWYLREKIQDLPIHAQPYRHN